MAKKRADAGWLVTGAASGFGREVARRLADRGEPLALLDCDGEGLDETASMLPGTRPHLEVVDVRDEVAVRDAVERSERALGSLGHVFNSAGVLAVGPATEVSAADYRRMIEVNYLGSVHVACAALPALHRVTARGSATLTLVASVAGLRGFPELAGYSASKFAVVGFAQALADELAGSGIRVKVFCPPPADTSMVRDLETVPAIFDLSSRLSAREIVDAWIEELERPGLIALVDLRSKALWRAGRYLPGLLDRIVRSAL